MKRRYFLAYLAAALAGTALHFLYGLLPNPLTALISPVNESVWEHLKLLYFPSLAAMLALAALERRSSGSRTENRYWGGFFLGLLWMPLGIVGGYYGLKGAFLVQGLLLDIGLFYLTMAEGFWLAYHTAKAPAVGRLAPYLLLPVILYGAGLLLFTFSAPALPMFLSS